MSKNYKKINRIPNYYEVYMARTGPFLRAKAVTTTSNPTAEQHLGGAMTTRQCNPLRAMHRGASYDIHRRCCAH